MEKYEPGRTKTRPDRKQSIPDVWMKKKLTIGLWAALLIFFGAIIYSLLNVKAVADLQKSQAPLYRTSRASNSVEDGIISAETAWSNYSDTGDKKNLDNFNSAVTDIGRWMNTLKTSLSGDPVHRRQFEEVRVLVNTRISLLRELFAMDRKGTEPEVNALIREELVHNALITALERIERGNTAKIIAIGSRMDTLTARSIYSLVFGALVSLVMFSGLLYLLNRELDERKRIEKEIKRGKEMSDALNRIGSLMNSSLNFDEIMKRAVREAARAMGCESSALSRCIDGEWVITNSYGFPQEMTGIRFSEEEVPFAVTAEETRGPVVINDAFNDPRANREAQERFGIRSAMVVPLAVKGNVFGLFFFNYHSRAVFFNDAQIDFAAKLSSSLSMALENARLFEAEVAAEKHARSELEISDLLLRAARALSFSLDVDEILDCLADIVDEIGKESRVTVSLLSRTSGEFTVAASRGQLRRRPGVIFRFEEFVPQFRRLFQERRSIIVDFESPDIPEEVKLKAAVTLCRLVLVCPLIFKGEIIGFISVDQPDKRKLFPEREIRLIEGIASEAAIAIEHARLYEEMGRTQEELESANERLSGVLNSITDSYFALDFDLRFIEMNPVAEKIFGRPAGEMLGRKYMEEFPQAADSEFYRQYRRALSEGKSRHFEAFSPIGRKWFEAHVYPRADRIEVYLRDITTRKKSEEVLRESDRRQKAILDNIPDMAWLKDREGRFIAGNETFARSSGKRPEDLVGKTDLDIWPKELAERYRADDFEVMRTGRRKRVEEPLADRNGIIRFIETIKTPILNDRGEVIGTTGIARDITERRQMEEMIRQQALHDPLTGLPNRTLFMDHFALALSQAHRSKGKIALMFLDLDRFKSINDSMGHDFGDKLLQAVGSRLRASTRETDTVARLGGDEFTILMPQIANEEDAAWLAQKILTQFEAPFRIQGKELQSAVSIGISVCPNDGTTEEPLMKNADAALYYVKEHGRNNYQFFNPEINKNTIRKMVLEKSMREMFRRNELDVLYQPQFDTVTGEISCVEALVRWIHPELGVLLPVQFIPLSEQTGLIAPIDEWVLRTACAQAKKWQEAGHRPFYITVNISSRDFQQPDFADTVTRILKETGLEPRYLDLEIKEDLFIGNGEQKLQNLIRLSGLGVRFSIDDFGTGYASLSDLRDIPVQTLKIDLSFIKGLNEGPDQQAIVGAMINLAHTLKKRAVAEGVENEEQKSFLRANRCDGMQGFLFGNPVTAGEFEELIRR